MAGVNRRGPPGSAYELGPASGPTHDALGIAHSLIGVEALGDRHLANPACDDQPFDPPPQPQALPLSYHAPAIAEERLRVTVVTDYI